MRALAERLRPELLPTHSTELPGPAIAAGPLLRLLQLVSPALPVGAFAFSQGLETAVHNGWIKDEPSAGAWLEGTLHDGLARLDLPVLERSYAAWAAGDEATVARWSAFLLASRESRERRLEDLHLGRALLRLLSDQGVGEAAALHDQGGAAFAAVFALGAAHFAIPLELALLGFAFSWTESQVGALSRLVPLGQLSAQRVLSSVGARIPDAVSLARALPDSELGSCLPGLAIASAWHEHQYCRLFKS